MGISLDNERTQSEPHPFIQERGVTWAQICDGQCWDSPIADLYDVHSFPSYFLVEGTTGKVIAQGSDLRGTQLRPAVEKALELPASPARCCADGGGASSGEECE